MRVERSITVFVRVLVVCYSVGGSVVVGGGLELILKDLADAHAHAAVFEVKFNAAVRLHRQEQHDKFHHYRPVTFSQYDRSVT